MFFCQQLCQASGSSLGYGFSRITNKPKAQPSDSSDDNQLGEGTLAIWNMPDRNIQTKIEKENQELYSTLDFPLYRNYTGKEHRSLVLAIFFK